MNDLLFLLILLVLSGFFSGAEIALFSLGAEKIKALKDNEENKAQKLKLEKLELLKADPNKLLVTILIGNNVVNVASSAIATVLAQNFARESGFDGNSAMVIGVVTGVMTLMILLFGEITPKSLAHKHAVRFSIFVTPFLNFLQFILWPVVWPLSKIVKKFSGDEELKHGLNEDEIKAALELSEKEGKIEANEKEWVEKILEFGEHSVETIMTPRSKIFAVEDDTPVRVAVEENQEQKYSRIPIFHEDLDHIVGILSVHGVLEKLSDPDFEMLKVANLPLINPMKIPRTMKIDTLLHEFQREQMHMALVYDENGGLIGLITLEDVLEEIFGEIQDEQDDEKIEIRQSGKFSFRCGGETELEQLENFIRERLEGVTPHKWPWTLEDENKTVSLFLLEKWEKFPGLGQKIALEADEKRFQFEVIQIEEEQIMEVEFSILEK